MDLISWLIFSSVWQSETHKEIRFITVGLVIHLIYLSVSIESYISLLISIIETPKKGIFFDKPIINVQKTFSTTRLLVFSLIVILFLQQSYSYYYVRGFHEDFNDVNQAMAYVGEQANVTGLIMLSVWFLTGGYTYFNKGPNVHITFIDLTDKNNINSNRIVLENLVSYPKNNNWLIAPRYQTISDEFFFHLMVKYNWQIVKIIDGKTEIWYNSA